MVQLKGWATQFVHVSRNDTLHMEAVHPSTPDSVISAMYVRVADDAFRQAPVRAAPSPSRVTLPRGVTYHPDRSLDVPPSPLHVEPAVYPEFARDAGIHGTVVVTCLVGTDGRVKNVKIVRAVTGLNDTVLHTVRQWTFSPGYRGGTPVASWAEIGFDF